MIKFCKFSIIVTLSFLFLLACSQTVPPSPGDTMGSSQTGNRKDWVDATDIYGSGAAGLELRGDGISGNYVEGILPTIFFDFDQSFIRPGERDKIVQAANYLNSSPQDRILIEGHCDWRGTAEYNLSLGDRRANSVSEYLATLGIEANRIETVSKGDLEAITDSSENQMQEDRRADLIVIQPL